MIEKYCVTEKGYEYKHQKDNLLSEIQILNAFHYTYEVMLVLDGKLDWIIEDRHYMLEKNDLVLVKPNEYHSLSKILSLPYERIVLNFTPNAIPLNLKEKLATANHVFKLTGANNPLINLLKIAQSYFSEFHENKQTIFYSVSNLLVPLLLTQNNNDICQYDHSKTTQQIISFINNHLDEHITIKDIADSLFISQSQASHIFKKDLNITINNYIIQKKMVKANELLSEGKKASEVAYNCGFSDYSSFYKAYKKTTGHSPMEFKIENPDIFTAF